MKLKQLESALSNCNPSFPSPQILLEQYPTNAHLAAAVALMAHDKGDLNPDSRICDLGCGTGMLSLSFALMLNYLAEQESDNDDDEEDQDNENSYPYGQVVSIDIDKDALESAEENRNVLLELEYLEEDVPAMELIHAALHYDPPTPATSAQEDSRIRGRGGKGGRGGGGSGRGGKKNSRGGAKPNKKQPKINYPPPITTPHPFSTKYHIYNDQLPFPSHTFDTVVTNPPFGTKHNEGIDVAFLAAACRLSKNAVYSFHKSSTRDYLVKLIETEWKHLNLGIEVVAQMKFDIPQMYQFHKEKSVDVDVDLIRVWHLQAPDATDKPNVEEAQVEGEQDIHSE